MNNSEQYQMASLYFSGIDHIRIDMFNKFLETLYFSEGAPSKFLAYTLQKSPSSFCNLIKKYSQITPVPFYSKRVKRNVLYYLNSIGIDYYEKVLLLQTDQVDEVQEENNLSVFDTISKLNATLKSIDASNNPYLLLLKSMDINLVLQYLDIYELIYLISILSDKEETILSKFDLNGENIDKKRILVNFKKLFDRQYYEFEKKILRGDSKVFKKDLGSS
ncbi:MAG: hypothetical protein HFJ38_01765 [Bacilli bacterium]|nr:hypothetical protein [Bacilli bacterium]